MTETASGDMTGDDNALGVNLAVFCGSSSGGDPAFRDAAVRLGGAIAAGGHRLVYGGGHVGLMGAVADAAMAGGAEVVGVITEQLLELEVGHDELTELVVETDMHARKAAMAARSDGVVVLPGGFGTLDETFEILTWNQLGIHPGRNGRRNGDSAAVPVVFLDVDGYFDGLFSFVERTVDAGFLRPEHGAMAQRTDDPLEAVRLAASAPPPMLPKWVDGRRPGAR